MDKLVILNSNKKAVGILSSSMPNACPFFDDIYEESLDSSINTFEFSIPASHEKSAIVEVGGYVLYPLSGNQIILRIMKITDSYSTGNAPIRKVECEQTATSDLLAQIVEPTSWPSVTLKDALIYCLAGTIWTVGNVHYFGEQPVEIKEHKTALAAIIDLIEQFGGEEYYTTELTGSTITKYSLNVDEKRGSQNGYPFYYSKNLTGVERLTDFTNLVTAVYAIGKDEDNVPFYVDGTVTLPAGYVLVGKQIRDIEAFNVYGTHGVDLVGIYESEGKVVNGETVPPTKQELADEAISYLKQNTRPLLTYKVDVELLGRDVDLGDSILVHDDLLVPQVLVYARIRRVRRSLSNPSQNNVEIGDYITITPSISSQVLKMQNEIKSKEEVWNNTAYKVEITSTNGFSFKNGLINTILGVIIYRGKNVITDDILDSQVIWTRTSNNPTSDAIWNADHSTGTKSIAITSADVDELATFKVTINT